MNVGTFLHSDETKSFGSDKVLINTEWGNFGSHSRVLDDHRTTYDDRLDQASLNRGKQIFEKSISGMYLGEITRLMMLDLVENGHGLYPEEKETRLFKGKKAQHLLTPNVINSKVSSA